MRVVVQHRSCYRYPRPALLGPQLIRLRPADQVRARVELYELQIAPEHRLYWLRDPHGNRVARVTLALLGVGVGACAVLHLQHSSCLRSGQCCIDRLNSPAKAVVRNWLPSADLRLPTNGGQSDQAVVDSSKASGAT